MLEKPLCLAQGLFFVLLAGNCHAELRRMTIRQWLASSRDYYAGVRLYAALGPNEILKRTLSHGPGSYNTGCLLEELQALARSVGDVDVADVVINSPTSMSATSPAPIAPATPRVSAPQPASTAPRPAALLGHTAPSEALEALKAARRPVFDERTQLHARLDLLPDDERAAAALRILELTEQLDASFAAEEYLKQHGRLPPAPAAKSAPDALPADLSALSLAELRVLRSNKATVVSKIKKKPGRADELPAAAADLERLDAAIKALRDGVQAIKPSDQPS